WPEPDPCGEFTIGSHLVPSKDGISRTTKKARQLSFKEELIGSVPKTQTVREDENFELLEGDVITEAVDGVPSIHFLDRFNWFIERLTILSVIVKLLSCKIGFATSVNKVQGLPEGLYNQYLLKAIGETIGPVLKIDHKTNNGVRGRFARLVVCVDLSKSLISKLKIVGKMQQVEYESLPNVCSGCGQFGHNKDFRSHHPSTKTKECELKEQPKSKTDEIHKRVEEERFGLWMLVERRQRQSSKMTVNKSPMITGKVVGGSRFGVLDGNLGKNEGEDDSVGLIDAEKFVARMEGNLPRTDSTSIKGKSS
ncbi:hypothetical protein Gogos_002274, partial [Gossypium gossypioides]|nr:hypothetical protein [Gossypium gossypioides]